MVPRVRHRPRHPDCGLCACCLPIRKIVSLQAAHAGWKGALSGITDRTLDMMLSAGAEQGKIVAAIGPAISQESYEVGEPFRDRFVSAEPTTGTFFKPGIRDGKFHFDLTAYVAARLKQAGISQISVSRRDTCSEESCFFSYRRSVHKGEPDYGRALSAIALAPRT